MNPKARRAAIVTATVAIAGVLLYAVFVAAVITKAERASADSPIYFYHVEDDDAALPNGHLVVVEAWSRETTEPVDVTLHYRHEGDFQEMELTRVENSRKYVGELSPLAEGERYFYYVEITDEAGNRVLFPEAAPDAPYLHVRFEGHVNYFVLGLHITLMIGAVFFLLHAMHFSWLSLRRAGQLTAKAYKGILWGWLCFFIGGIPLGIYVSGSALGWHNAWGGWPLGTDITDSKTELLIVYWGALLALRPNHLRDAWNPIIGTRAFAWMVFAGAGLTTVVYAIPHSIFFQ